jgi:hypothetical protein
MDLATRCRNVDQEAFICAHDATSEFRTASLEYAVLPLPHPRDDAL